MNSSFFQLEWGCYWLFWLETPLKVWPTSWLSLPLTSRCERNSGHRLIVCHKFWADYYMVIYTHCEVRSWWCQWGVSHCCSWWRVAILYFVCDTSKLQQHTFLLCLCLLVGTDITYVPCMFLWSFLFYHIDIFQSGWTVLLLWGYRHSLCDG
jgi:hypothetical protein